MTSKTANEKRRFHGNQWTKGEAPEAQISHNVRVHESGAVRSNEVDDVRFDLISPHAIRRLAAIYAEGAKKYGDHNHRKGFPLSDILNHGISHLNQYLAGDRSEDQLAKVAWAMFTAMEMEEIHPDMDDLYFSPKNR